MQQQKPSLEGADLPGPPRLGGWGAAIGRYCECDHPYTKWMLNMLRGGASFRISTMLKERPQLFTQTYQVPDCPDLLCHDPHDALPLFSRHSVLFLNPLCLAIYMKRDKCAELILKSGLNSPHQRCWACEVFSRSQQSGGDLLELYPVFIAIRREYFEAVSLLACSPSMGPSFEVTRALEVRYESKGLRRLYRYRDTLQYALDTLKRRGTLPLSRLLEVLILDCPGSFEPSQLLRDKDGSHGSLFLRLAKVAYFEDPDCRIVTQLLQCLEVLLRHRHVPWGYQTDADCEKDHTASVTLLFAIYNQIQMRVKNGPLDNLGYLIMKTLQQTQTRDKFLAMTPEQIQQRFGRISPEFTVPLDVISIIKRHIHAIMELEKEREFKVNIASKFKGVSHLNKNHRRSYSLKERNEETTSKNLLQSRGLTQNINGILAKSPPELMKSQKQHFDQQIMDETVPIYSYQTGNANCYTQTTNSLSRNNQEIVENDYQYSQNLQSTKNIQNKYNLIPGLKKKSKEIEELRPFVFHDPTDENSELSESSHIINCIEMTPMKACTRLQMSSKPQQSAVQPSGDINYNRNLPNHYRVITPNPPRSNNNSNQFDVNDSFHTNQVITVQTRQSPKPNNYQRFSNLECCQETSLTQSIDEEYEFYDDNKKLVEFEDDLFDELFIEYSKEKGRCTFDFESINNKSNVDDISNISSSSFLSKNN